MQPIYQSRCGRVILWCADCRQVQIPAGSIAIFDPPYNIGTPQRIQDYRPQYANGKFGSKRSYIGHDFGEVFDNKAIMPPQWIPHMPDTVACFYGAKRIHKLLRWFERAGYEIVQDFHWCKINPPPPLRGVGFAWAVESGYLFRRIGTKHVVNRQAGSSPNFLVTPGPMHTGRKLEHCTQKPVRVMKWLVRFLSTKESLVVDPFMGSGTTGVAAIELGRKFMGIEISVDYCQIAIRRLRHALDRYQSSFQLE